MTGRYSDPWLWGYVATVAAIGLYPTLWLDDDLAKERFSPPEPGADRRPLAAVRTHRAGAHRRLVSGRALADQPRAGWRSAAGIRRHGVSIGLFFRAMMANRFFSAVIRIQKDRGHHVIDQGPYAVVRHPGYAGMVPSMAFSGLALGSWFGFAIGLGCSLLMLRRVVFEDAYLRATPRGISGLRGARALPADSRRLVRDHAGGGTGGRRRSSRRRA